METILITIKKGNKEINWWTDSRYEKEIEAFFHKPGLFDELPNFVSHFDDGTLDNKTKSILKDRLEKYKSGESKAVPWEDVKKKIEAKIKKKNED